MKYQIPKGLFDVLPYGMEEEWHYCPYWHFVETTARKSATDYGFQEIRTPVFERTELFDRGVGPTSDIVKKEMYTFEDKAKRSMSLRPEGTSSVMRAFIEKRLHESRKTHKFYYLGPMFRYERPQSGRYRQHHQFGVEAIGVASFEQDAEVIDLIMQFYHRLGLRDLTVMVNSVGDTPSRVAFRQALIDYFKPHRQELSKDSQERLEKNPLRILDSKDPKDREIVQKAPSILEYLSEESKKDFDQLCDLLKQLHIPFKVNDKIVRGLDYYTKTVFEVTCKSLGAQDSIGAGGRYDGLIAQFGGPNLPGIGFGTGLERILQAMIAQKVFFPKPPHPLFFIIPLGEKARAYGFSLVTELRHKKIPAEIDLNAKKIQQSLQAANQLGASYCLIIGNDELETKKLQCKNLSTRQQEQVSLENIIDYLEKIWIKHV